MSSSFASLAQVSHRRQPSPDHRRAERDLVDMVSHVTARGRSHGVRIINISPLGLMCRADGDLIVGERVQVWLPVVKDILAAVRWTQDGRAGLEFLTPIETRAYAEMLALIPPRRTAW